MDYGEFVAVTIHLQRMENDEHFRKAFTFFDKDGSGYIELDELREALVEESGEADLDVINDIMREVDTDKVPPKYLPSSTSVCDKNIKRTCATVQIYRFELIQSDMSMILSVFLVLNHDHIRQHIINN